MIANAHQLALLVRQKFGSGFLEKAASQWKRANHGSRYKKGLTTTSLAAKEKKIIVN